MSYSVESINSESNNTKTKQAQQEQILQMQQLKEAKTQESGTKVEDSAAVTATERKTDTIEISAEGQKALEQIKAAKAGGEVTVPVTTETSQDETAAVTKTTDSDTSSVVEQLKSEDSDDMSSTDLYTMTESELRTLVANGTITRKEMEKELERRSTSE